MLYSTTLKRTDCLYIVARAEGKDPKDVEKQIKVMEFLLNKGLDINKLAFYDTPEFLLRYSNEFWGGTPLHYTTAIGCEKAIKLLLSRGANPNIAA